MARSKAHDLIKSVSRRFAKKKWQAQANRIRRRTRSKSKRVC